MQKVYPDGMVGLFGPLVGLAEEGLNLPPPLRPSIVTEEAVKQIYESEIKPHFASLDPRIQNALKVTLRYVLHTSDFNYQREFDSMLLPFDCPKDDPKLPFRWVWEVLFPNEQSSPLEKPFEVIRRVNVSRHILEVN